MKVAEKMLRVVTDWGIKESNKPVKHTPVLWKGLISPVIRTLRGQVRIPAASRTDAAACARPPSCRNGVQIPCSGVRMGPAGA